MVEVAIVFDGLYHIGSNKMAKRTLSRRVISVRPAAAVLPEGASAELGVIVILTNVVVKEYRHHLAVREPQAANCLFYYLSLCHSLSLLDQRKAGT